jgi:hypothetical protein
LKTPSGVVGPLVLYLQELASISHLENAEPVVVPDIQLLQGVVSRSLLEHAVGVVLSSSGF